MDFFSRMQTSYSILLWSISIESANPDYSPFALVPSYLESDCGLFDDSFMHKDHDEINESRWLSFDYTSSYKNVPFGGEFSYFEYPCDQ